MSFLEAATARYQQGPSAKRTFNQRAWAEFSRLGLPDRKNEGWKYSSLDAILKQDWQPAGEIGAVPAFVGVWREKWKAEFDVLTVINGELRRDLSEISTELNEFLGSETGADDGAFEDGFASLSAALSRPSLALKVPNGVRVLRPVMIIRAQVGAQSWEPAFSRVSVGEGAQLDLAEVFLGEDTSYLRSELARAHVASGAHLRWLRVQRESATASHFSDVRATLETGAVLHLTQVNGGAAWSRTLLRADIKGREAEAYINGLSFGAGQQHIDQRVVVNHHAAQSTSAQLFKNVLKDQSRGVLNGKIYIAQDAQKVSSAQYNHSLLIGSGAEADTKPELEIYADDVKANHGATIGRLDEDKLFYLESRGIRPEDARAMLTRAFVDDVAMKMPSRDLRAALSQSLRELTR